MANELMTTNSALLAYHAGDRKLSFDDLRNVPTPAGTATHQTIPHYEVVGALIETLNMRHLAVHGSEFAIDKTGNKMFGIVELSEGFAGARFALGIRNSNDKSMRLAMTVGYRVMVCSNMAFNGEFTPVLAKHSKNLNLLDSLSVGVDHMQRNFAPMVEGIDLWKGTQLSDVSAKLLIYEAFIEAALDVPKNLDRKVHSLYFDPMYEEFQPRTLWSLTNAFTSALKDLEPVPQFKATAAIGQFFNARKLS